MLQVKDPQEVFDENIRPLMKEIADESGQELVDEMLNTPYSIFVLGEMYGTISTCLAQNIPIPKALWDMPIVRSFVRGDVDDVVVVDERKDLLEQVADIVRAEMPDMNIEVFGGTEEEYTPDVITTPFGSITIHR